MLQDLSTEGPSRRASSIVLETERLVLRQPTLADVKAIACLANDRRIAENTRQLPHPYTLRDAEQFICGLNTGRRSSAFLITYDDAPIGMAGLDWSAPETPALGYWLGVEFWGHGFATEAARAVIDFTFRAHDAAMLIASARVVNPASRRVLEKCGFQWTGVELHRFTALGSSTPVDTFRLDRRVWSSLKRWRDSVRRDEALPAVFMPAAE